MFGRLNRILVAALVAGIVLVAPSAVMACNGGPSAENVYKECLPNGGGKPSGGGGSNTSESGGASTPAVRMSRQAANALKHAPAKDRRVLSSLLNTSPAHLRLGQSGEAAAAGGPSAIGSALELGSGPTALLAVLAGVAALLLVATTLRGRNRSPRS